jgi:hypothetical protein
LYYAEVVDGGHAYRSQPLFVTARGGATRLVVVRNALLFALHGGANLDDEELWFQVRVTVANFTGAPVRVDADGLLVPFPAGFKNMQMQGDEAETGAKVVPDKGLLVRGPIPPGQKDIIVQFSLRVDDGSTSITWPLPLGLEEGNLSIEKFPEAQVQLADRDQKPPLGELGDKQLGDGRDYMVLSNLHADPGDTLQFSISGLPMRSPVAWWTRILTGLVVVALFVLAFIGAVKPSLLRSAPAAKPKKREATDERKDLERRRDRLYDALVELEKQRAAFRVDEVQYDAQRKQLVAKLVMIHRELEELGAVHKGKAARAS